MARETVKFVQRIPGIESLWRRRRQRLEFSADNLTCRVQRGEKEQVQQFLYGSIPSAIHFRRVDEVDEGSQGLITLAAAIGISLIAILRGDLSLISLILAVSGIVIAILLIFAILVRVKATIVPLGNGIKIYRDGFHDAILDEFVVRRQEYFATKAIIDPSKTVRNNLRNLRWLADIRVLSDEEFSAFQQRLLSPDEVLVRPSSPNFPNKDFTQRYLLSRTSFKMRTDHVAFERSLFGKGRFWMNILYTDIPPRTTGKETSLVSRVTLNVFLCLLLGLIAFNVWLNPSATNDWYSAFQIIMELFYAVMLSFVLTALKIHSIMPGVFVISSPFHGTEILYELEKRRVAIKKAKAEPDPLLTNSEQLVVLNSLKRDGVLSELEFQHFSELAGQKTLAWLDEVVETRQSKIEHSAIH